MILLLLASSKRKVTVTGEGTKYECCDVCGCEYSYVMTREAEGEDKSLFSWTDKIATRKAADNARKNLAKILEAEKEPVPCPDCGWVQASMIEDVRRRSYLNLRQLALACLLLGLGGLIFALCAIPVYAFGNGGDPKDFPMTIASVGATIAALGGIPGAAVWAFRHFLNSQYDPNRGFSTARG